MKKTLAIIGFIVAVATAAAGATVLILHLLGKLRCEDECFCCDCDDDFLGDECCCGEENDDDDDVIVEPNTVSEEL